MSLSPSGVATVLAVYRVQVTAHKLGWVMKNLRNRLDKVLSSPWALRITVMAFALLFAVTSIGLTAYAADPTDAAGLITDGSAAVTTAFPILPSLVVAAGMIAIAAFLLRKGVRTAKTAS